MKFKVAEKLCQPFGSLPLRGAWIEIIINMQSIRLSVVAPLAGGVD